MTTSARQARPPGAPAVGGSLLAAAVLLVALNLRSPIVAVSPVVDAIRSDLGVSSAVAGLLTSLPVLMFAVASTPASWLTGRIGPERAMLVGLAVLGVGTVLRSVDGVPTALVGTALIGAGITVGNVVVPVVIGRDFPHRSGGLLGLYVATMNVGSMITLWVTVPIADGVGWRWALTVWLLVAAVSAVVWSVATRGRCPGSRAASAVDGTASPTSPWRRPVGWQMLLAFGAQAFSYYGLTAWLPEILADLRGLDPAGAGAASSIFQVLAVVGALGAPLIHHRTGSLRAAFLPVALGWLVLPLGLLFAPGAWPVWCALGGAAQGGGFTVFFAAILAASRDTGENRRLGAFMQTGAYLLGSLGPFLLGALHADASWTVPLLVVTGALVVLTISGWLGASPRHRYVGQ
ncbi:MAG: transporter, family, cyanate transporter [Actinomycetota bacterium]|nr:transporter, family, cyanate transporter [Actinomycetota bacterium]